LPTKLSTIALLGGSLLGLAYFIHARNEAQPAARAEGEHAAPTEVVDLPRTASDRELASPTVPAVSAAAPVLTEEASLMATLHGIADRDPQRSLELARDGNRRFPNSPDAAERAAIVVKSLALEGHLSEARAEAEAMVNQYPGTAWAAEVERHTGAHPRLNQH
jgi:hypothetical protein